MSDRLDSIDRHFLRELQDDGRITNVELARRVGISAPPCLRRVRALEEAGYIKSYRALLDEKKLGFELTAFAMVHLSSQADADLQEFERFVRTLPLVRECWMLSGEIDFVLKCVAPNLTGKELFVASRNRGVLVRKAQGGLQSGDLVTGVNGQPIATAYQIDRALQVAGQAGAHAQVLRSGAVVDVALHGPLVPAATP